MPQTPRERELFVSERPVRSDFGRSDFSRSEKGRQRIYARRRKITLAVLVLIVCGVVYFAGGHSPSSPATVPTIKTEGDYKQKPENPGGIDIPHQDVEIYNKIENKTAEMPGVEHLLPMPETPQDVPHVLAHVEKPVPPPSNAVTPTVDKAIVDKVVTTGSSVVAQPTSASVPPAPVAADVAMKSAPRPAATAVGSAVKDAITGMPDNMKNIPTTVTVGSPSVSTIPVSTTPVTTVPVTTAIAAPTSLVPSAVSEASHAPTTIDDLLKRESVDDAPVKATAVKTALLPPAALNKGMVAVQLASVPDQTQAQSLLENLQQKYATELSGVSLRLARVDLGSRGVYYRIQGQNLSEDTANHICSVLKQKNAGCILVRP